MKKNENIKKISGLLAVFALACLFSFSLCAGEVSAQEEVQILEGNTTPGNEIKASVSAEPVFESTATPSGMIKNFYNISLGIAVAAAFIILIYGAVLWTVSGAIPAKQDAIQYISAALWGLALLLAAYLILYTINPDLVNLGSGEGLFKDIGQSAQQAAQQTGQDEAWKIPITRLINCATEVWTTAFGVMCAPAKDDPYSKMTDQKKSEYIKEHSHLTGCKEGETFRHTNYQTWECFKAML